MTHHREKEHLRDHSLGVLANQGKPLRESAKEFFVSSRTGGTTIGKGATDLWLVRAGGRGSPTCRVLRLVAGVGTLKTNPSAPGSWGRGHVDSWPKTMWNQSSMSHTLENEPEKGVICFLEGGDSECDRRVLSHRAAQRQQPGEGGANHAAVRSALEIEANHSEPTRLDGHGWMAPTPSGC